MTKLIPLLILLSGCSVAYIQPEDGEWVGEPATLAADTAKCHEEADTYLLTQGGSTQYHAHWFMERCMTKKGYVWRKTP